MKYHILAFGAGFLLDQIFGDPYFLPHPIRGIGWLIAKTEKHCAVATHRKIPRRERQRSVDRGSFWWQLFCCLRECLRH